jgi:hypothetical protein
MQHTATVILVEFATRHKQYTWPTLLNYWNGTVTSDNVNSIKNMSEGQM